MNATANPMYMEREESGLAGSFVLALLVHLLLFAVLFFGVRWQSRPPEPVTVELWVPPAPVVEQPAPKPEPRIEPKPEPVVEVPKPDIVIPHKAKPEPKPKPEAAKPKPEPVKPPPIVRPRDDDLQKRMREELAREQNSLRADRDRREITDQLTREQASAQKSAMSGYADKIKAKIKGNISLPQDIKGNPEAIFEVVQLPTGEVLPPVRLKKSSGHKGYDEAVERAILKSSPLPKPDRPELFVRVLDLKFRPLD